MTPALVRGFADTCLGNGADGVYLFNFFEENDTSSFEFVSDEDGEGHLENCFGERVNAANFSENLPRRYVHIGNSNERYPIVLRCGDVYEFTKKIKSPFTKCRIVIGCDLDVTLSVPVTMGNEFQNQIAYLDWEFKIEEFPVDPDDPIPPPTGDDSNVDLWFALMMCSLFMLIFLLLRRKKGRMKQ
jgi:hypothetical protein